MRFDSRSRRIYRTSWVVIYPAILLSSILFFSTFFSFVPRPTSQASGGVRERMTGEVTAMARREKVQRSFVPPRAGAEEERFIHSVLRRHIMIPGCTPHHTRDAQRRS